MFLGRVFGDFFVKFGSQGTGQGGLFGGLPSIVFLFGFLLGCQTVFPRGLNYIFIRAFGSSRGGLFGVFYMGQAFTQYYGSYHCTIFTYGYEGGGSTFFLVIGYISGGVFLITGLGGSTIGHFVVNYTSGTGHAIGITIAGLTIGSFCVRDLSFVTSFQDGGNCVKQGQRRLFGLSRYGHTTTSCRCFFIFGIGVGQRMYR